MGTSRKESDACQRQRCVPSLSTFIFDSSPPSPCPNDAKRNPCDRPYNEQTRSTNHQSICASKIWRVTEEHLTVAWMQRIDRASTCRWVPAIIFVFGRKHRAGEWLYAHIDSRQQQLLCQRSVMPLTVSSVRNTV